MRIAGRHVQYGGNLSRGPFGLKSCARLHLYNVSVRLAAQVGEPLRLEQMVKGTVTQELGRDSLGPNGPQCWPVASPHMFVQELPAPGGGGSDPRNVFFPAHGWLPCLPDWCAPLPIPRHSKGEVELAVS